MRILKPKRVKLTLFHSSLDKFDGKTGSHLKPFLAKFDILARRCQWNDDMKVDMLKCNLTGAAAQLLWDDPSCQNYEQLVLKVESEIW